MTPMRWISRRLRASILVLASGLAGVAAVGQAQAVTYGSDAYADNDGSWEAGQNPDGSWVWGAPFFDPSTDSRGAVGFSYMLLTGGQGLATIDLNYEFDVPMSSGLFSPTSQPIPNAGSASGYASYSVSMSNDVNHVYAAQLTAIAPDGTASMSGSLAFQVPYNSQFSFDYNVFIFAAVDESVDDTTALCGTPSATNTYCGSGGYADVGGNFTINSITIPQGSQLAWDGPVIMAPVPEPAGLALMACGLAALLPMRRRCAKAFRPSTEASQ